jgi:putative effector of murein hydrolase
MTDFVELWVYLSSTPLFGLTATLTVYVVASAVSQRVGLAPWANPVLWSVLVLSALLLATDVAYPTYFSGAQFIHFLLGPAVVAMAWPLWTRRAALRQNGLAFGAAALVGGVAAAGSAGLLAWWLDLPGDVVRSLIPKSMTAPVAMGVAEQIGGVPALAALAAVITGMVGGLSATYWFSWLGLRTSARDWTIRGFAIGTAAHGIGAARANQLNADAGAYAGLALGLQVLLGAVLLPWLLR